MSWELSRMAFGYVPAQIVHAAVRLGIPDALVAGPLMPPKLARAVGCDPGGLTRLLRAMIVLRLVDEAADGHVRLTALGRPLCADHPRSMRSSVLLSGHPAVWGAWGALADGVRTGEAAFDQVHGRPLFDWLAADEELSTIFNTAMREGTGQLAREVPRAYDFSTAGAVVDVGGGDGTLLAAVLAAVPDVRGILYDTVTGAAGADAILGRTGPPGRWSIETGDFFTSVPRGDVLLVKGILHDWDDERCVTLLRNCRESIAPDGRLLVLEPVLPERLDTADAAGVVLSDIAMLAYTGGRERSRTEFQHLFEAAGFRLLEISAPLVGSPVRILVNDPV
ncbi:methyltransferase [Micromonosporaceae bacterium Da 78-11]